MNEQQQKLYDKLLKKVNEYCLGQAAEDVIAAIDALVESYETPKVEPLTNKELTPSKALKDYENTKARLDDTQALFWKYQKALEILKRKKVDMALLLWCFENGNCLFYNQNMIRDNKMLEDEEYDLLKEILK